MNRAPARIVALTMVAIFALTLVPAVPAAGPQPASWAPYNAGSDVVALGFAREGTTVAAGLAAAVNTPRAPTGVPGIPGTGATSVPATDLAILDTGGGFARNGSITGPTPLGRSHVAVSRDGTTIATLGIDQAPPSTTNVARLHFLRATSGNYSGATPYERVITLGPAAGVRPVGLALSDDGRRLAVLTGEGTDYVLRGYTFGSTVLDSAFQIRAPGDPRALAVGGDLTRVLVAGQFPVGNFSYGGAFMLPFAQGDPSGSWFDDSTNGSLVVSASMSRDGQLISVGAADGKAHVFRTANLATPTTVAIGAQPVSAIRVSEDGSKLAAASGMYFAVLDARNTTPTMMWNTTLSGQNVSGVALNRTGGLIVVGTRGTGGGAYAFDDTRAETIWSQPGDTRGVALDSAGTRVVYAQRAAIYAAEIPRALTMDLTSGGKIAAQRIVAFSTNESYEVTLRNDGAATERVVIEEGAPDLRVTTDPAILTIRAGAVVRVNVTVHIDAGLVGPRVFNLTARSLTSSVVDNVTLSLAPRPTLDVRLLAGDAEILAQPGVPSTVLLTILNNGTSDVAVGLRASQLVSAGEEWTLDLTETSLNALRGTRTSVNAIVTPPASIVNGTSSTVTFTLEGRDVFDTARVTFRVNPDLKVEVNATGVTKFIEPGKRAGYNVTVTNTGSLPRDFEIFHVITESSGRSWGVDMGATTLRLEPRATRVFPVTIVAPADALPQERVSVLVTARSLPEITNDTIATDSVTLYGVAVPLTITTTTTTPNGVPALPLIGLVAAIVFALVLPRRRFP